MARRIGTERGSWFALVALLLASSVVVALEWHKECDGGLRTWLLTTVCVTSFCSILGAIFHGRGDGTRLSRFLDDNDDDANVWGVEEDSISAASPGGAEAPGFDLSPMGRSHGGAVAPPQKMEEGEGDAGEGEGTGTPSRNGDRDDENQRGSMEEDSNTSGVPSSISCQLAAHSSSLQHRYFGPGHKVFPDPIFLVLVASQWFLAGWSVVGAALYFRLFVGNRTCAPLLRHWTLLVVIIGFVSCLLAVCYSGIMFCMFGLPLNSGRRRNGSSERDRFQAGVPSSSD